MTTKPIAVTLKGVIKAARKLAKLGKLQFQKTKFDGQSCEYNPASGIRCAVGAVFTTGELARIKKNGSNGDSFEGLVSSGLVTVPNKREAKRIQSLQQFHDGLSEKGDKLSVAKRTERFLAKLDKLEAAA